MTDRKGVQIAVGCEFVQTVDLATHAVVQVEPRPEHARVINEHWTTEPGMPSVRFIDSHGNLCRRLDLPPGTSTIRYDAVVDVPRELDEADESAEQVDPWALPADVLRYTLPSRFCPSDSMSDTAWELFADSPTGFARVQAVCDYVNDAITFQYGTSTPLTTAADVHESGMGVCRDFTHLAVTFCRSLGFPTRYAFGYLPDIDVPPSPLAMDFCAWMEVFVGGRWFTFDPRNNARRIGRVLIGRGRDALDVAMVTSFGFARLDKMVVVADEVPGS